MTAETWLGSSAIDAILGLILLEAVTLLAWRRIRRSGPSPAALLANLAAGACLFLALRTTMTGSSPLVTGLCLVAALSAHLTDLALRWGEKSTRPPASSPELRNRAARDEVSHG